MATIEERAKAVANKHTYTNTDTEYDDDVLDACIEIATEQDQIARQEEREKAELNFCIFCSSYDNCDARYSCETFNKFHNAMMEE